MRDFTDETRKLADLAVGLGANVQPGQIVAVTSYTGKEELTRAVTHAAYERGARYVDVLYFDPWVKRERIEHAPEESLGDVPPWMTERLEWLSDEHAARITLNGPTAPSALDGLDPARAGRDQIPYLPNSGDVVNRATTNWCIVPAPTRGWATAVYPDASADDAVERLWDAVVHVCRLDEPDPETAWLERMTWLKDVAARITTRRFRSIRLHGPGTDLTVGLFRSCEWHAADFQTVDGLRFYPNLPSEEMFTTPDPALTEGHVSTTMPKELYGAMVDGIRLEFEGGRVTRVEADRGADALRSTIARDDGGSLLGEIALVDGSSRVGKLATVFFETLLDENAVSHIALGNGYELTVTDPAERERITQSEIHVDLMIGSPELHVDGITDGGEAVPILRQGTWQI
ncbi:MAG: aminopeptidase [Actinobacteria bacterium]|nr:MAG: aminopeptidase [Actinomycetota bacterium]